MSTIDAAVQAFREVAVRNCELWGPELSEVHKFGCQAIQPMLSLLKDDHPRVREAAADVLDLWNKDERIVDPLIAALGDPDRGVRWNAVVRLGSTKHLRAVEPLIGLLDDDDSELRKQAVRSLSSIGGQRAMEAIIRALREDPDTRVRASAAYALTDAGMYEPLIAARGDGVSLPPSVLPEVLREIGDDESKAQLIDLLRDGETLEARKAAARALRKLGDDDAVEPLKSALADPDWRVRLEAAIALHELGDDSGVETFVRLARSKELSKSLSAAIRIGGTPVPRVIDVLVSMPGNRRQKLLTARVLADVGDPRGIAPLIEALEKGDGGAAISLGHYKEPRVVDALVAALENEDAYVRMRAIDALGMVGDSGAVGAIADLLETGNKSERLSAAKALARIADPRATTALIRALDCNDACLRRDVAAALTRMRTPEAAEALVGLLSQNDIDAISGAYAFYVEERVLGSENALLAALSCHGDKSMAECFANSGSGVLAHAGRQWLSDHPRA